MKLYKLEYTIHNINYVDLQNNKFTVIVNNIMYKLNVFKKLKEKLEYKKSISEILYYSFNESRYGYMELGTISHTLTKIDIDENNNSVELTFKILEHLNCGGVIKQLFEDKYEPLLYIFYITNNKGNYLLVDKMNVQSDIYNITYGIIDEDYIYDVIKKERMYKINKIIDN